MIALVATAGLAASNVMGLEVELDLDDPVAHYDVNFKQGNVEYVPPQYN